MKYEDVLKRFVSTQAQLLQEKQMRQQQREQMLAEKAQGLQSFVPGMQGYSPEEEYNESEHNPFEEGGEMDGPPRKRKFQPYTLDHDSQVQQVMNQNTSENGSNFNQGTNRYNRTIDIYKNGAPSDTNYMFTSESTNSPFEEVYFSTKLDPITKQPMGQKRTNDKFSQLTPEERKYYQAKIMQELQRKEADGGEFDKPRFSLGMYASPEMGSSVSPSLNFERGNFNANLSTNIPIETPNRYSKNLNVDANYNTGKFGNIGVSGSTYRNEEGLPAYNAGLRYEVPITDKLNFMLNADTSSFKNLKDNANVSAGLRYTFEDGGSFNNPGFNALPKEVQDKIIAAMMYGGSFDNNNWD
jgi:hypothetical protein